MHFPHFIRSPLCRLLGKPRDGKQSHQVGAPTHGNPDFPLVSTRALKFAQYGKDLSLLYSHPPRNEHSTLSSAYQIVKISQMSNTPLNSPRAGNDSDRRNSQTCAPPESQDPDSKNSGAERRKRTRTGCVNCSRRRRKCDEVKPTCTGCKRRGDKCQWRMLGAFRDSNIKVLESDHPSMSQGVSANKNKRQSRFKILNTAPNTPRRKSATKQQAQGASEEGLLHEQTPLPASNISATKVPVADAQTPADPISPLITNEIPGPSPAVNQGLSPPYSSDTSSHLSQKTIHNRPPRNIDNEINVNDLGLQTASPHSRYPPTIPCAFKTLPQSRDDSSHPYNSSPEYVIDDLNGLRDFDHSAQFHSSVTGSYQTVPSPLFNHNVFSDPADLVNDVFLPGSAYEALHTTLRNRQLWTARPDIPSRRSSQDSVSPVHTPIAFSDVGSFSRTQREPRRFELSPEREHVLWENYLNEICSWVSLFFEPVVWAVLLTLESSTCLITIAILLPLSLKWPSLRLICVTLFWHCLRDSSKDSKTENHSQRACHCIKKPFTSYYPSWEAKPLLS